MKKRIIPIIFALLFICQFIASCSKDTVGESDPPLTENISSGEGETTAEPPVDEYIFPELNCGGEDFDFLSVTTTWDFYTDITKAEIEGEVLSDAIYNRNRLVEEKFNVNLKETGVLITDMTAYLKKTILSGEDIYEAAYCPGVGSNSNIGSLVMQNMFHNLKDIPELQLDQYWWNQNINKDALIGNSDALYFTSCDVNIMNLQGAWCVYFNENMFTDLGLELPYAKVKSGKWTLDEFYSYAKAGARLNGDASFPNSAAKWNPEGASIYGVTSYEYGIGALVFAAGEKYIVKDEQKMPRLAIENERFFNVCDKIISITKTEGEYQNANDYASGFHFEMIFRDERAMMLIGELKAADVFRAMQSVYGIVPLPKYDGAQESYHTIVHSTSPLLVIPTSSGADLSRTGAILDALAYVSHKDVTPVFYDITLSLKRLQNSDSIEMLKIIRDSVSVELGIVFGWTADFINLVNADLDKGGGKTASIVEKNRDKIQTNIDKTLDFFGK